MRSRRRMLGFGLALVLSVCAAIAVSDMPERDSATVAPAEKRVVRDKVNDGSRDAKSSVMLDKLARTAMTVGDLNPFGAKSWYVPPPPAPALPPPKPTAPPLPFAYVGKLEEEGNRWSVYLSKGEQFFVVKKGETFDSVYRLEGVENGNLVILYIPLSTRQFLPIGGLS